MQQDQIFKSILLPEDPSNGLVLNDTNVPEEVLTIILSYVSAKHLLDISLVCKTWCRIIRALPLWSIKYKRHTGKKAKKLPWYIYYCYFTTNFFDRNLLIKINNCKCGYYTCGYRNSIPIRKKRRKFEFIEIGKQSTCFNIVKITKQGFGIKIPQNKLLQFIFLHYTPHIYVKERLEHVLNSGYYSLTLTVCSSAQVVHDEVIKCEVIHSVNSKWTDVSFLSVVSVKTLITEFLSTDRNVH